MVAFILIFACLWGTASIAEQEIKTLTEADEVKFLQRCTLIIQHLDEASHVNYETSAGNLGTVKAILGSEILAPYDQTDLEALGIVFGDTSVQEMGFNWIVLIDGLGRDYAVRSREMSIIIFPIAMMEKRIRRGERVDIFDLYSGVAKEAKILISNVTDKKSSIFLTVISENFYLLKAIYRDTSFRNARLWRMPKSPLLRLEISIPGQRLLKAFISDLSRFTSSLRACLM